MSKDTTSHYMEWDFAQTLHELAAVTAERDALSAELSALKKRVADAPRKMIYPRDESEKTKWVAVLDLEDGK